MTAPLWRAAAGLALVFAAIAAFAGACQRGLPRDERPLVASVSGIPIYADELKRELARIKLDDQEGLPAADTEDVQKKALLDDLIDRHLIMRAAERANVIVSTDEVEAAFGRARAGWDEEEFNAALADKDMTPAELKEELRTLAVVRKYFRDHVFSRIAVTDQEVEAYVAAHPEVLVTPERVRARHIVLTSEEEAQRVLGEINAGLPFADAAMKYSQSPVGKNGGDLGLFPRGVMPRVFDEVCFSEPIGKVSKVVPGDDGFYLFKVLERLPVGTRQPEAARHDVEKIVRRDKERAVEEAKKAELRSKATITIEEDQLARIH